jgi:hypothetical protein
MENNNSPLDNYIVKRLENLEYEVENLKEERETLHRELAKVEEVKELMRSYFILDSYTSGQQYIDHSYDSKPVKPIADFIGLKEKEESEDEDE